LLPLVWLPPAGFQFAACLVYVAKGTNASSALVLSDGLLKPLTLAYFCTAAGADIIIAASLTWMLSRDRSVKIKRYEMMMQRLAVFSINSGLWTAVFALLAVAMFVAFPTDLIYVVFDFPLCPVYCNTLLANLNVRSHVRALAPSDKNTLMLISEPSASSEASTISEDEVGVIVIGRRMTTVIGERPTPYDALSITNTRIYEKC